MRDSKTFTARPLGTALAAVLALGFAGAIALPAAAAPPGASQPSTTLNLSTGRGTLVSLSAPMSDLFVANDTVADVQVRSSNQLYIFAKAPGETTIYATSKSGAVVYSANIRVGTNISTVDSMLSLAMPDSSIQATPMNGLMLLTGTVASPDDAAEAERLAQAFVGKDTQVISRLKTATPLQVNLQVRIAEVSRDFSKSVGFNILTNDSTNGFKFGVLQGRAGSIVTDPDTGQVTVNGQQGITSLIGSGKLFGVNVLAMLDLAENDGLVTTLANPNLTALSGETASFLAGGEIPIPISQALGSIAVEYKQYGVSLAFTPTVLADGRISMRVRPEVSQLSTAGAVTLNGYEIPSFTTRRAETTVELGSGQSFMIGGLLSSGHNNSVEKAPFLGDLPILGALFRSKSFRRTESELVIVVTPYLVKPVSANRIALPSDGYHSPTDAEAFLMGQTFAGKSGEQRPVPTMGPAQTIQPGLGVDPVSALPSPAPAPGGVPARNRQAAGKSGKAAKTGAAAPGFTFD